MATRRVLIGQAGETVRINAVKFRKQRGLTLKDVAQRLGQEGWPLSRNTVNEIELGARRIDVDDLVALAAALEVLPIDLLGVDHTIDAVPSYVLDQLSRIIEEARA